VTVIAERNPIHVRADAVCEPIDLGALIELVRRSCVTARPPPDAAAARSRGRSPTGDRRAAGGSAAAVASDGLARRWRSAAAFWSGSPRQAMVAWVATARRTSATSVPGRHERPAQSCSLAGREKVSAAAERPTVNAGIRQSAANSSARVETQGPGQALGLSPRCG
jgi:hypothetical protein